MNIFGGPGDNWEAKQMGNMGFHSGVTTPLGAYNEQGHYENAREGYNSMAQLIMLLNQYGMDLMTAGMNKTPNPLGHGLGGNYVPGLGPMGEPGGMPSNMYGILHPRPQASEMSAQRQSPGQWVPAQPQRQPGYRRSMGQPQGFMFGGSRFGRQAASQGQAPQQPQMPQQYPFGQMGLPYGPLY